MLPSLVTRRRMPLLVLAAALLLLLAPSRAEAQRQGGTLRVLTSSDPDSLDPGITYSTWGLTLSSAMHRTLYSYRPTDASTPVPDLAAGPPEIAPDGRSVTIRLRPGVRYSPPVERAVTSRDVKYAIERGFFRSVATPYAGLYFADIVGARPGVAPGTTIAGIETPDDLTVVFRLRRPRAGSLVAALVMTITAPVPPEYAAPLDRARRSTYGVRAVATGPYRLASLRRGRGLTLARNPNWDPATDFRPAPLDVIEVTNAGEDTVGASRRILAGSALASGDYAPAPATLRQRARRPGQFSAVAAGAVTYVSLNTTLAPFRDVRVRRAIALGFDRARFRRATGGPLAGDRIATHFIPPGVPGHELVRPVSPLYRDASGDRAAARRRLRAAGYDARRLDRRLVRGVAGDDAFFRLAAGEIERNLEALGFRVRFRFLPVNEAIATCGRPAARVHLCPGGWFRDFPDAQTVIDPLFSGDAILPEGNNNWGQLDVPRIDRDIEAAKGLAGAAERARAWAAIDRRITALVPAVPLTWPSSVVLASADVAGVHSQVSGLWDLSFTGLR